MGQHRIPVSLKFDDTTDFYNDFITDLRETKMLSSFIVEILFAYYDNPEFREHANEVMKIYDPLQEVKKQIERAQLEHQKAVMATTMLETHIEGAKDDIVSSQQEKMVSPEVMQRLERLESALPSIEEKLNILLSLPSLTQSSVERQYNNMTQPLNTFDNDKHMTNGLANQEVYPVNDTDVVTSQVSFEHPTTRQNSVLKTQNTNIPTYSETQTQEMEQSSVELTVDRPIMETPVMDAPVMEGHANAPVFENPNAPTVVKVEEEETVSNKPASFGKAFKSIRKG